MSDFSIKIILLPLAKAVVEHNTPEEGKKRELQLQAREESF